MARLDLLEKKNSRVETLSGGQRQRLAVAIAIISNGEIIFLDEPTVGLDPQARRNLWGAILELKDAGKTVFLTTHFMEEAQNLCDRVAIIDYGRLLPLALRNSFSAFPGDVPGIANRNCETNQNYGN